MSKKGHIPIRTCIGCEEKKPKREMIRIVRQNENIFIDSTGKASGRGAYICVNLDCLEKAIKKKALAYALRCSINPEILESLKRDLQQEILKRGERDEKKNL
ncbi:MAG: RNase P modulator RnpM [Dictyoglomaceae bacterium]